jgi:hypothetical protein
MEDDPSNKKKAESEEHFQFGRKFVRRPNESPIYIPEAENQKNKNENHTTTVNVNSWLPVSAKRDRVALFFTIVAVLISAIGTYILMRYTQAAFNQVTATQNATNSANQNAISASLNSWAIAEMARKTAIDSDRPWIGVTKFAPTVLRPDTPTNITFTISNGGKRPGRIESVDFARNHYKVFPSSPQYEGLQQIGSGVLSKGVMLPGAIIESGGPFAMLHQAISGLKELGETFYIYGKIQYTDVLTHERHFTHVCIEYSPDNSTFVTCPTYNDAD